ncbi:hypothetical protein DFP72DRAFT_857083 [Ephemerocybe angulata]|uniref:Uncharacterized protein n=1 Tax=Ephemerocybe angulata TaxID=980116 RepID=A0A8H6LY15_9AGAR|nr:hypothetical protein DFP72DRAFT_857083 [Tulosesus angulatus]
MYGLPRMELCPSELELGVPRLWIDFVGADRVGIAFQASFKRKSESCMYSWSYVRTEIFGWVLGSARNAAYSDLVLIWLRGASPLLVLPSLRGLYTDWHALDSSSYRRMYLARTGNSGVPSTRPVSHPQEKLSQVASSALTVAVAAERGAMGARVDEIRRGWAAGWTLELAFATLDPPVNQRAPLPRPVLFIRAVTDEKDGLSCDPGALMLEIRVLFDSIGMAYSDLNCSGLSVARDTSGYRADDEVSDSMLSVPVICDNILLGRVFWV